MLVLILILILPLGVDYCGTELRDLRKAMSYLGQEELLVFPGTLRKNLDFDGYHTYLEVWKAIESRYCSKFISSACDLDEYMGNNGKSFGICAC